MTDDLTTWAAELRRKIGRAPTREEVRAALEILKARGILVEEDGMIRMAEGQRGKWREQ